MTAFYDFFRKITLQPDGVTLEADSISDTLTITGGNGVAFNPNAATDSFTIDVDYQLFVPVGTTSIRLNDVNSNHSTVNINPGNNIAITRNASNELVITSTVGGTSKVIGGITQASPGVVTTTVAHGFTEGIAVTITDVTGMTQVNGNEYYMNILTSTTFALYTDSNMAVPLNTNGFDAYTSGGIATAEYAAPQALNQLNDVSLLELPVAGDFLQFNGTYWGKGTDINGTFNGDLSGSVFADDSTLIVDGVNGTIPWAVLNGTPTTLTGYGITDSATFAQGALADSALQTVSFAQVTSPPTTLTGYGITDAATSAQGATADSALQSVAFADLTTTPTTLAGYGITDAASTAQGVLADSALQSVAFTDLTATPTTLSAYGITDAASTAQGALADSAIQNGGSFDGDVVGSVFGDDSTVIVDGVNNRLVVGGITIGPFTAPVASDPGSNYITPAKMAQVDGSLHVLGVPRVGDDASGGYYSVFEKGIRIIGEMRNIGLTRGALSSNFMPRIFNSTGVTDLRMNYEYDADGAPSLALVGSGQWYMYQPATDCTTNLTGLSEYNEYTTVVTLTIYQASTPVLPPLQIDGVAINISWQYGVVPTVAPAQFNVIQYQCMRLADGWYVLGHMGIYS
jgi:hypothetical protein